MSVRSTVTAVVAMLVGGVGIAACSSSGSGSPAATTAASKAGPATSLALSAPPTIPSVSVVATGGSTEGACKYVSTAQASQLAGSPVKPGVARSVVSGPVAFSYCDYIFDPGNAPGVTVAVADLKGNARALYEQLRASKQQSDSDYQEVSGVGDAAFYASGDLYVLKGNGGVITYVGRINSAPRGPAAIPDEKKLAEIVLAQL